MANKKNAYQNKNTLSGLHVYKDKKGRNVYLNTFNKIGYVISENDEKSYRTYSMRFLMGIMVFILLNGLILPAWLSALLGLGCYAVMELKFRNTFLPTLTQIPDFQPMAKDSALTAASHDEKNRIMIKCGLYLAFGVLMALNTYMQKEAGALTPLMEILSYLLALAGIGMFVFQLMALSKNMKDHK